jgi:hypothetical protein
VSRHLKRIAVFGPLVAAVIQIACHSLADGAKSYFSTEFTCPMDRVEVRPRPDLHPSDWSKPRRPPSEIASDPGRLKMWQDEQDKLRRYADSDPMFEVQGCGHHVLYDCGWATRGAGALCRAHTNPPPASNSHAEPTVEVTPAPPSVGLDQ